MDRLSDGYLVRTNESLYSVQSMANIRIRVTREWDKKDTKSQNETERVGREWDKKDTKSHNETERVGREDEDTKSHYLYKHVINLYLTRILEFIYRIYYRTILTVGILIIILLIMCNCFRL